jgi:hypothetical protein
MDEIARHQLWSRLDEVLGPGPAATLMELLDESYRMILARQRGLDRPIEPVIPFRESA